MARGEKQSFAKRMAAKAFGAQLASNRLIDVRLGLALMRDNRVPVRTKGLAMAVSAAVMAGVIAIELPLEGLLALAVPLLGGIVDLAADGAEATIGTMLLTALILPRMAPREVVDAILAERG